MSKSVEDRVVSLEFDNAGFLNRIKGTLKGLGQLDKSISDAGKANGLKDLEKAAKNFKMEGISSAVDGVSKKFLLLSTIAITALSKIASKAIDVGAGIVKSFAFDPIFDGFKEYETNMNSIQTILANTKSKGTELNDVTAALDELNTFADQTIYNFSEMARNIGTFTAAGVELETATGSIKGIANLAAISGSNSQQAATAMYQLSQAISTGSLKLMDWNSVVNAGLGGEVFQSALFESGKAMGTLNDVPIDQTFQEWTDAGNTFRETLTDGWITGEVLTNTLQGFTGDLTDAQLLALGYNAEQIVQIQEMGATALAAATEVKTFTQLIDTVKEAVGSGWSESFKLIIGDFNEAKELFTGISDFLGEIIGNSADTRNAVLRDFKRLGGRDVVIRGLKRAVEAFGKVLSPIKKAFRDIFPKTTASDLIKMALAFAKFTNKLIPGYKTVAVIRTVFRGFFGILAAGIDIVKGIAGVFTNLFQAFGPGAESSLSVVKRLGEFLENLRETKLSPESIENFFDKFKPGLVLVGKMKFLFRQLTTVFDVGKVIFSEVGKTLKLFFNLIKPGSGLGGGFGNLALKVGTFLQKMRQILLTENGIKKFFIEVRLRMLRLAKVVENLKEKFSEFYAKLSKPGDDGTSILDRIKTQLGKLKSAISFVLGAIGSLIGAIAGIDLNLPSPDFEAIKQKFSDFWTGVKAIFSGDGEEIDLTKGLKIGGLTAIIGSVVLLFKSLSDVFSGFGDITEGFGEIFEELGDTLGALQVKLKADALQKIATAIAILTASLVVLSLIDAAALTKALTATAVGFGQLATTMAVLSKVTTGFGAAKLAAVSATLIGLATAILILSVAMKVMSTMSWEEIAKGLGTVTALLGALVASLSLLSGSFKGYIKAGVGILLIAGAMLVLAVAMKIFATMSWEEIAKGLAAVAGGLLAIVLAMDVVAGTFNGLVKAATAIFIISAAMVVLAVAMKLFATMKWEEIAKGIVGVAGGLLAIAGAMTLMPSGMLAQSAALVLVSIALNLIATAMKSFADMSWEEIARGLVAMGGALAVLAAAAYLMQGTLLGAAAIATMALSLGSLIPVLKAASQLSFGDLAKGLAIISIALGVLGAVAYALAATGATLAILGISAALVVLGVAMASIGAGAYLMAKAFKIFSSAGPEGVATIGAMIDLIMEKLPKFLTFALEMVLEVLRTFIGALPEFIGLLVDVVLALLDALIELIPKVVETGIAFVLAFIEAAREIFPQLVDVGLELLQKLLDGISENIEEIATVASEIIVKFLGVMEDKAPELVTAGLALITAILEGITENLDSVVTAGKDLVVAWIKAIGDAYVEIIAAGAEMIGKIIEGIGNAAVDIVTAGADAIISFLEGVASNVQKVIDAGFQIVIDMLNGIAESIRENRSELVEAGLNILSAVFEGVTDKFVDVGQWFSDLPSTIVSKIGSTFTTLGATGRNLISGLYNGTIGKVASLLSPYLGDLPSKIVGWVGSTFTTLGSAGANLVIGLWNGIVGRSNWVKNKIAGFVNGIKKAFTNPLEIFSPSRLFKRYGDFIGVGLGQGIEGKQKMVTRSAGALADSVIDGFDEKDITAAIRKSVAGLADNLQDVNEFNPTITPVLDLSNVQKDAKAITGLLGQQNIAATSLAQANGIALATQPDESQDDEDLPTGPTEVNFNQTINAPTRLSTADIYRGTKSQIAVAKEELSI